MDFSPIYFNHRSVDSKSTVWSSRVGISWGAGVSDGCPVSAGGNRSGLFYLVRFAFLFTIVKMINVTQLDAKKQQRTIGLSHESVVVISLLISPLVLKLYWVCPISDPPDDILNWAVVTRSISSSSTASERTKLSYEIEFSTKLRSWSWYSVLSSSSNHRSLNSSFRDCR